MPQILTDGRRATLAGSSGVVPAATNARAAAAGSAARTQGLADESAVEAEGAPPGDRGRFANAGFGDDEAIVRHEPAQARRPLQVHLERPQIAVVEADEPGPGRERALELAFVMGLDERFEADLERTIDESSQSSGRMEHRQQQHEVRAGCAKHRQLARVDDEVLGEDRDADRRPDGARSATEPPNQCGSHSTEIAAAPPSS